MHTVFIENEDIRFKLSPDEISEEWWVTEEEYKNFPLFEDITTVT